MDRIVSLRAVRNCGTEAQSAGISNSSSGNTGSRVVILGMTASSTPNQQETELTSKPVAIDTWVSAAAMKK
jgi:hypothetical protein